MRWHDLMVGDIISRFELDEAADDDPMWLVVERAEDNVKLISLAVEGHVDDVNLDYLLLHRGAWIKMGELDMQKDGWGWLVFRGSERVA